jgi:hypothetical protein
LNLCYYADDKNRLKPQKLHIKNVRYVFSTLSYAY